MDSVVPVMAYHQARATLEHYGFPVSGYSSPFLMHNIDDPAIASGVDFFKKILI
jgi:predicted esterase